MTRSGNKSRTTKEHASGALPRTDTPYARRDGKVIQLRAMVYKEGVAVAIADPFSPGMWNMLVGNARGMFGFSPSSPALRFQVASLAAMESNQIVGLMALLLLLFPNKRSSA